MTAFPSVDYAGWVGMVDDRLWDLGLTNHYAFDDLPWKDRYLAGIPPAEAADEAFEVELDRDRNRERRRDRCPLRDRTSPTLPRSTTGSPRSTTRSRRGWRDSLTRIFRTRTGLVCLATALILMTLLRTLLTHRGPSSATWLPGSD